MGVSDLMAVAVGGFRSGLMENGRRGGEGMTGTVAISIAAADRRPRIGHFAEGDGSLQAEERQETVFGQF